MPTVQACNTLINADSTRSAAACNDYQQSKIDKATYSLELSGANIDWNKVDDLCARNIIKCGGQTLPTIQMYFYTVIEDTIDLPDQKKIAVIELIGDIAEGSTSLNFAREAKDKTVDVPQHEYLIRTP